MARVGLCEDDPAIRRIVTEALRYAGHEVLLAHTGTEALRAFGAPAERAPAEDLDVVVLDIGLPDADGRDVCQALRASGQAAPVLFLTALGAMHERLSGFSAGGDDYLPKPFDVRELIMRVEALARRGRAPAGSRPSDPDPGVLVLDPARHSLACAEREVLLSPTEFRMLAAVASRPGEVVRRRAVVAAAWPDGAIVNDNTVDSFVRRIRAKMREVEAPVSLVTVRGVGYALR